MSFPEETKKNPFRVLEASPRDSREILNMKQAELALLGESASNGQAALTALLHPQSRLEAEMRWFPGTEKAETDRLLQFMESHGKYEPIPPFATSSVLARFNALRLQLTLTEQTNLWELEALLHSLAIVADALFPRQVMEEINADRNAAGFPRIEDASEINRLIRELFLETIRFFLDHSPCGNDPGIMKKLAFSMNDGYKRRESPYHNSYLIELAAEEAALRKGEG